jgi:hypothetical protein
MFLYIFGILLRIQLSIPVLKSRNCICLFRKDCEKTWFLRYFDRLSDPSLGVCQPQTGVKSDLLSTGRCFPIVQDNFTLDQKSLLFANIFLVATTPTYSEYTWGIPREQPHLKTNTRFFCIKSAPYTQTNKHTRSARA